MNNTRPLANENGGCHNFYRIALAVSLLFFFHAAKAQLSVALLSVPPTCHGFSNGKITAVPSGSIPPYNYLWSTGNTGNPLNNIPAGTYSVTVTSSTGATATAAVTLGEPPVLQASITVSGCTLPGSMTVNVNGGVEPYSYAWSNGQSTQSIGNLTIGQYCVTVTDDNDCVLVKCQNIGANLGVQVGASPVVCGNATGGSATANPNGGVTPYSYLWSNGGTTATISNLPPGTYTVTLTSANGCTATDAEAVVLTSGSFGVSLASTNPTCSGSSTGSITANPNGGALPFMYNWSSGQSSKTINNLMAGSYSVTVTDHFGCTASQVAVLTYQSNLTVNLNPINPTCAGANNGSISANPNGGVLPYNYNWSTGSTSQTISNAGPGAYTVTVTDALGCTGTKSITLVSPPAFLVTTTAVNAMNCGALNGSVSAMPGGGGTPPFSYIWSNGATGNLVNGLGAGTYTVTVTSSQGCTASSTATVGEPHILNVNITGSALVCGNDNNGSLTANYTFGTPPYSFSWSNGGSSQTINSLAAGTYTVTVTSSQGCTGTDSHTINGSPGINLDISIENVKCFGTPTGKITVLASGGTAPILFNWSNGATSNILPNLNAGQYTMTVSDAAGCSKVQTITVTQPAAINLSFTTSGGSCGNNGFATANVSGGTMPYQFAWNTGQTTQSIFGIPAGDFAVTVTDANQCSAASTANIFAYPAVGLDVSSTNTTCNGTTDGTATATASAGTPPFEYFWGNGATSPMLTGLSPGNYKITVTDDIGCTQRDSVMVLLGDGLIVNIDAPTYVCPGLPVSATAQGMGGLQPYTYAWSNGQTTQTAINLNAGSYSVIITDPMGCSGNASVDISPGGGYSVNFDFENVTCNGGEDGSAEILISGGLPPYQFLWSTGDTVPEIDSLAAGDYPVTISDATGCTNTQLVPVSEPTMLELNVQAFDGGCGGLGAAVAQTVGGVPSYKFLWNTGDTTSSISNLVAGLYILTVTDANLCSQVDSAIIVDIPLPICEIELAQAISGLGLSDGQLQVMVEGGTPPFTYNWNNGQTSDLATNLNAGNFFVTVSDINNCQAICNFFLYNPGSIGDFVWEDNDMDGIQDNSETGLAGVKIDLAGVDNYGQDVSKTATTNADGKYLFTVQPGKYQLTFTQPNGYANSPQKAGNDGSIDSDVNPFIGTTDSISIGNGEENFSTDAGFFEAAPCENVTNAGSICCDQTFCGPGQQPAEVSQGSAPSGGSGNLEYLWFFSTEFGPFDPLDYDPILNSNEASFTPEPVSQTTYFVRGARREGCFQYLYSNIVTFHVDSLAVAAIVGPDTTCIGVPVDFTCLDNGAGATYAWSFQDAEIDTANTLSVTGISWNSIGPKTVRLEVQNQGCISVDELQVVMSNTPLFCGDALIINAEPVGPTTVLVDWFYSFTDSVDREYTLEWAWESDDFKAIAMPDSTVIEFNYLHYFSWHKEAKRGRNYYRVKLEDSDGTVVYSNIAEVIMNGGYSLVHVYPNPFSTYLDVEIIDRYDSSIRLELMSVDGRRLGIYNAPEEENYLQIDTQNLSSGIYFLLVKYDYKPQKIFKLVKWGG